MEPGHRAPNRRVLQAQDTQVQRIRQRGGNAVRGNGSEEQLVATASPHAESRTARRQLTHLGEERMNTSYLVAASLLGAVAVAGPRVPAALAQTGAFVPVTQAMQANPD